MSTKWEPETYHKDPMVNALLNIAAGLHSQAQATQSLFYGLKYGKNEGLSIAEAIEVVGNKTAGAIDSLAAAIEESKRNEG